MYDLIGRDNVLNWMHQRGCPYWKLFDSETSSRRAVASNWNDGEKDGNVTIEDGMRSLKANLDLYPNWRFYLWVVDKTSNKNGGFYTWISQPILPGTQVSGNNPISGIHTPVISDDEIQKRIQKGIEEGIEKYETKRKLDDAIGKVNELTKLLKDQDGGGIDLFLKKLEPYLPILMKAISPELAVATSMVPKVAGPQEDGQPGQAQEYDPEAQKIAEDALTVLADGEPEIHLLLKKLADLKKNNPQKFEMAKSLL